MPPSSELLTINYAELLCWPLELETGTFKGKDNENESIGGRIPFTAFNYIRTHFNIDLSLPEYAFADRGKRYASDAAAEG